MSTSMIEPFAFDPLAPHSAQFPLGGASSPSATSQPSSTTVRPWGLRGMRAAHQQGDPLREAFGYDHARQIAVNAHGQPLTVVDATANKVTSSDGDEGPSEDFTYDYCPDSPVPA